MQKPIISDIGIKLVFHVKETVTVITAILKDDDKVSD